MHCDAPDVLGPREGVTTDQVVHVACNRCCSLGVVKSTRPHLEGIQECDPLVVYARTHQHSCFELRAAAPQGRIKAPPLARDALHSLCYDAIPVQKHGGHHVVVADIRSVRHGPELLQPRPKAKANGARQRYGESRGLGTLACFKCSRNIYG